MKHRDPVMKVVSQSLGDQKENHFKCQVGFLVSFIS